MSVSSSVAHAAKYAKYLDEHDAILALCYACYAFDLPPIDDEIEFENWFFEIAINAALEKRKLTDEEKFSYSTDLLRKMMNGRPF